MADVWYNYRLTVAFNGNGDNVTNLPSSQSRSTTVSAPPATVYVSIPNTVPERTGYNFLGYARSSDGDVFKQPGETVSQTFTTSSNSSQTITLYCKWEQSTYTVSYNANGGSNAPESQTKTYGTDLTLSDQIPARDGYAFVEWNTVSDGTGTVYNPGGTYSAEANAILYAQWRIAVTAPTFTTQPSSNTVYRGASASISCAATAELGTLTLQWQVSLDNSTWDNIEGATSASYTVSTATVGTVYYRCVASATYEGYSESTNSSSCYITVRATPAPNITSNPSDASVIVGEPVTLSVSAVPGGAATGMLSYQWQISADGGTSWDNVAGATERTYSPSTVLPITRHYRCVVTNTLYGYSASANSGHAKVSVMPLAIPFFTVQPVSASYAVGSAAAPLTVTASSNGTVSYQWQESANGTAWSNISGATSNSYTPSTEFGGATYYRCVATAASGSQSRTANSNAALISVVSSSAPVFRYDLSQYNATYIVGDTAKTLNGSATVTNGTISYQWQKSTDGGATWFPIQGANESTFLPPTNISGTSHYRVVATNSVGTATSSATSNSARIIVTNYVVSYGEKWSQYLKAVSAPFIKLARLDFLNPNGSVLFSLDNNPNNQKSRAFIQDGELSVNLQNGMRRTATVTLSNLDGEYDYNVNKLWFGQQVQLWEGMRLPNGSDFYISQGVFYVQDPVEVFEPGLKQTTLNLVDKWAYLDGTLFGNLDGTYEVPLNSNIFNAIQSILNLDRGNGQKVDSTPPVFTSFYNEKTTTLPDGSTVPLTNTPYTYRCDAEEGTYADIILELNTMLAGWIGYDANGQLRLDPSQDDILDTTKPVQWAFSPKNSTFLGATYSVKNSEVYNDIIIIGESLSDYGQTSGRATNYDPRSDTNANMIGLKTKRYSQSGYYTQDICESLAAFKLKRESVLKKSVSIKCAQMFHLQENNLVTVERTDKLGNPVERHLITGFTRPIAQTGEMVLNCTAVNDLPIATITAAP